MASVFDYIFRIGGNFVAQMNGMSAAAGNFTAKVAGVTGDVAYPCSYLSSYTY